MTTGSRNWFLYGYLTGIPQNVRLENLDRSRDLLQSVALTIPATASYQWPPAELKEGCVMDPNSR